MANELAPQVQRRAVWLFNAGHSTADILKDINFSGTYTVPDGSGGVRPMVEQDVIDALESAGVEVA